MWYYMSISRSLPLFVFFSFSPILSLFSLFFSLSFFFFLFSFVVLARRFISPLTVRPQFSTLKKNNSLLFSPFILGANDKKRAKFAERKITQLFFFPFPSFFMQKKKILTPRCSNKSIKQIQSVLKTWQQARKKEGKAERKKKEREKERGREKETERERKKDRKKKKEATTICVISLIEEVILRSERN